MNDNPRCSSTAFVVLPLRFGYNNETAKTNSFQNKGKLTQDRVRFLAMNEFRTLEMRLGMNGLHVMQYRHPPELDVPDAVFANNWITTHKGGKVILYPMLAPNRRLESHETAIARINRQYEIKEIIDLRGEANKDKFLEGSGSLVFDRKAKIIYASISERTHPDLVKRVAETLGYKYILFDSKDKHGNTIYHTNVMMSIGNEFVIWCKDSISNQEQVRIIEDSFKKSDLNVIEITLDQMHSFVANCLCVYGDDEYRLLMSSQAYNSLTENQKKRLKKYVSFLHIPAPVIEEYGGGSIRCMITEIYLKRVPSTFPY